MEIYERIRHLRKDILKLSRDVFGERLGVKRDVIKNIELNLLARPEQKEPLYKLICAEFNVSYDWLITGNGDMRIITKQSFVEKLTAEYGLSRTATKFIECYLNLDDTQKGVIDCFVETMAQSIFDAPEKEDAPTLSVVDKTVQRLDIYRAAQGGGEHEIIPDGQETIAKLQKAKSEKVTSKDDF